ncbi:hypothetical protein EDM00_11160 [Ornithobacterium rhinotracheale]|uniref:hypothetical protein n=1 Tax=Ornithobacterium rhinotracheale TaxID=28251 RepID=UPI00129C6BBB|nr:hypothetical protein [Ornithobacterium rhinotracheale]MRI64538.1 hypothetical protein [Ornithobacterium rhinotracheale]MRJ11497.1 hypothetical protein [Ornithobacterium rhinotracheale]
MTPRKELFIKIKKALASVQGLELIDLQRGQFDNPQSHYPEIWTAALIQVMPIRYETMTEHLQEGSCDINIDFYCKDGWTDQHLGTADPEHGLMELDILDGITDALQFLQGEQFKPLQQTGEDELHINEEGIMSYRLTFSTIIYRRTNYPFDKKFIKLSLNND